MELRHLRYFMAVAEEKNFTRAAARVGIGQPPLSQQIKDLEAEIGTRLFHRLPYGAELTEAGQTFYAEVVKILKNTRDAVTATRRTAQGETGELSLGFTGTAGLNPVVSSSIRSFRHAYPQVILNIEEGPSVMLLENLLDGTLDAAVIRPSKNDPEELCFAHLVDENLVVAMPASHDAAPQSSPVALADLIDEPLIVTPPSAGISLRQTVLDAYADAGLTPHMGPTAPQIVSLLSLVAAELGVTLVPETIRHLNVAGVSYHPLQAPAPHSSLAIAYRKARPPQTVLNFTSIAGETVQNFNA